MQKKHGKLFFDVVQGFTFALKHPIRAQAQQQEVILKQMPAGAPGFFTGIKRKYGTDHFLSYI